MIRFRRDDIERKLADYLAMERELAVLQFELKHPVLVSEEEVQDAMNYAKGENLGGKKGYIPDRTMYIALNYQQRTEHLNREMAASLTSRLLHLEQETSRLNYYVSLLDRRQDQVVRQSYFERMTNEEIARSMDLAPRTVQYIKKQAIDALTEMYNIISDIGPGSMV